MFFTAADRAKLNAMAAQISQMQGELSNQTRMIVGMQATLVRLVTLLEQQATKSSYIPPI